MLNLLLNKWIDRLAERIVARQQHPVVRVIGNSNLGYRRIGDLLTFYAATSLATGAANDADSAPTYIIYEEENATEIVTSTSMALLDSATTNGLYSEQVTLAEATGYEFQKDYLIYITATVSSIVSHAIYSFRIGPEGAVLSANAQAGAAGTITLHTGASTTDDLYNGMVVVIIGGTGAGQARTITDYVGSTRVATIEPNWITNPSSSSIFAVYHWGRVAVHTDGITAASIANAAIDAATFAAGAIDAAAIADGAIDAGAIANGAIDAATFAAGAIDAAAIANGAIDAATFAAGAIDAAAIADGAIDAATFAAGAITATVIATDAIDADALATDAVNEIAAATAITAADAVWDEARAGHVAAGSFGEGVASVQGNVTGNVNGNVVGSVGSVVGNVGGNVVGSVGSIAAGGIVAASFAANSITAAALASDAADEIIAAVSGTADSGSTTTIVDAARTEADTDYWAGSLVLITSGSTVGQIRRITAFDAATDTLTVDPAFTQAISTNTYLILRTAIGTAGGSGPTVGQIADAVWDEDIVAAHGTADTAGLILSQLTRRAVTFNTDVDDDSVFGQIADDGTATFDRTTDSLQALADAGGGGPTAGQIADAVWDELRAGHVIAGSFGEGVASVQGNVVGNVNGSVGSVVGNVGGNVTGSVGSVAAGGITAASFAANSITAAATDATFTTEIEDTVWDATIANHLDAGSTGEALDNASTGGGGTDWTAGERDQIRQALGITGAVAPTTGTGTLEVAIAAVQADTNDLQTRLPASLNGGRMRSHVEAMDAGTITAATTDATFATEIEDTVWDAPLASHLDPGSTGEALDNASTGGGGTDWTAAERAQIREALGVTGAVAPTTGVGTLETAAAVINADTNDIQARLPATLNGGRMRSHVEACDPPCTGGGGGGTADTFEAVPG